MILIISAKLLLNLYIISLLVSGTITFSSISSPVIESTTFRLMVAKSDISPAAVTILYNARMELIDSIKVGA